MKLDRRNFLIALGVTGAGITLGLKSCETGPSLVYSYDDTKGFISEIQVSEPNSPKNIKLTWSPNSNENSVIIDRQIYIEPVEGNFDSIVIEVNSTNQQVPQSVEAKGTILQEDNKKQALLEVTNAWENLVGKNIANKEDRSKAVQDFVNKYLPDIKDKILDQR